MYLYLRYTLKIKLQLNQEFVPFRTNIFISYSSEDRYFYLSLENIQDKEEWKSSKWTEGYLKLLINHDLINWWKGTFQSPELVKIDEGKTLWCPESLQMSKASECFQDGIFFYQLATLLKYCLLVNTVLV